jgi:hypothetical protein
LTLLRADRRRAALRFLAAWGAIGMLIAVYNYERFGNPVEFGFRYQLAGPGQNRVEVAARNWAPGAYYMLLARPEFSRVFPWMRMVFRFPFDSAERHPLPPEYFVEPTVGALWLAPFLPLAFWVRRGYSKGPEARLLVGTAAAAGVVLLLFLISTHLASHRYEVDFVPLLLFAAIANVALTRRKAVAGAACIAIVYSATANLALAVSGPYDDYLQNSPRRFVRLAGHFSPTPEVRPAVDPAIRVRLSARFAPAPAGYREPLVTIGGTQHNYFLYAVRGGPTLRLVSKANDGETAFEMPEPGNAAVGIELAYAPQSGEMTVRVDGREAVRQRAATLVTAPAQVAIGENFADMGLTSRRFLGEIAVVKKAVGR